MISVLGKPEFILIMVLVRSVVFDGGSDDDGGGGSCLL